MGQYFVILNTTKREFLHPHKLGSGLKLWEICASKAAGVLVYLLRQSNELGGGDVDDNVKFPNAGRWAGDSITVVGDYDKSRLYQRAMHPEEFPKMNEEIPYKDISLIIRKEYEKFLGEPLGKRWDKP